MAMAQTDNPTAQQPLRLWPGVIAVVLQWLLWLVVPLVVPDAAPVGVFGGLACGLAVVVWWLFFSRAAWAERVGAIVLMVVAGVATQQVVHRSLANGMMGFLFPLYAIPALSLALVAWAVATRRLSSGRRRAALVAAIVLACASFTLLRTGGVTGAGGSEFHWRWTRSPEERLLAQTQTGHEIERAPAALASAPATAPPTASIDTRPPTQASDRPFDSARSRLTAPTSAPAGSNTPDASTGWSGFRGPHRDGIIRGMRIRTDWPASPPVEMWRRPVGPGWSSFAVGGDLVYTQEQRGDDEVVSCYSLTTGAPVWRHRDAVRFWESNAGAGPRATPTLSNGRVYTLGATGILNALDASNGTVVWSRNVASDTGAEVPVWGFSSSPVVVDDVVIVHAGMLVAYGLATGDRRWSGPARGGSYSSPQLLMIGGVAQILMMSETGATSVAPADGTLLWEHPWPGSPIVQPARVADGDVLVSTAGASGGVGMRRLAVAHGSGGWKVEERWTSIGLKPYFNDFVVHKGHAFGFDGSILGCIDLQDGQRRWKGGRYGYGQLVLLPDQDLLLVLSEEGGLALVAATPERFTELARFPGVEGKTWNHPVLVGDVLLVRNGQEMAAFRLSPADR